MNGAGAAERAARWALAVGVLVLAGKLLAAWWTSSLALLSDALESVVNVAAAAMAAGTLRWAARPPDANHPFGHAKAEYLSAGFEGALVASAAVAIGFQAILRFGAEPHLPALGPGLAVSAAATGANLALALRLERVGRSTRSPALLADALHLRSDVWTSIGAYVGIGLAWWTRRWELDALVALAVAAHILVAGLRAIRSSLGGLLDEGLTRGEREAIEARIGAEGVPVIEHHDLRTRRAGPDLFVEFHLVVEGGTSVSAAHEICDRLETSLRDLHPGARVTIHVEPEGEARGPRAGRF